MCVVIYRAVGRAGHGAVLLELHHSEPALREGGLGERGGVALVRVAAPEVTARAPSDGHHAVGVRSDGS
eukprot:713931-Pyramimonas_sp.AAC.1